MLVKHLILWRVVHKACLAGYWVERDICIRLKVCVDWRIDFPRLRQDLQLSVRYLWVPLNPCIARPRALAKVKALAQNTSAKTTLYHIECFTSVPVLPRMVARIIAMEA